LLEPKVVIPMHYQLPQLAIPLGAVEELLSELGVQGVTPQARLSVTVSNMPAELRVVVLEPATR
ncbi:MAG: lactamase, partial [Chloroflexi bacterium]|nr:lactamase [Chloroflexota bacterium]